jgi:multiple sugar transport system substrate-binding protein
MKLSKRLLAILAICVLMLSCTAVTGSAEGPVTITWWSGNGHDLEYIKAKVAEYNATNKDNIQINFVYQSENTETMLALAIQSGQAPDMIGASSASSTYDLVSYINNGYVQPLNPYITDSFAQSTDCNNLKYQGINAWGDDIYWVPTGIRGSVRLIYNVELFKNAGVEVPTTLDELVTAAKKITEYGKGTYYGTIMCGASSPWERFCRAMSEKSGILPYDYVNGVFDFTGYEPIIKAWRQVVKDGSFFPGTDTMKVDVMRANFAEGLVGFYGNAAQEVGVLTSQFPTKMEWAAAPLPTLDGEVKGAVGYVINGGYQMVATTKHPAETFKVIEWLSSDDFLIGYYEGGFGQAINPRLAEKVDQSKIGKMTMFGIQSFDSVYPKIPAVTPEGDFYETALWNLIWNEEDIASALKALTDSYNAAYEKEIKMGKTKRLIVPDFDIMNPGAGSLEYSDK